MCRPGSTIQSRVDVSLVGHPSWAERAGADCSRAHYSYKLMAIATEHLTPQSKWIPSTPESKQA
jgi:hypothetical protein